MKADLFDSGDVCERPSVPDHIKSRPPRPERCAVETYNLPQDWQVVSWEKVGMSPGRRDYQYLEIKGGVYRHTVQKGKNKGDIDFRKPEPGTVATVSLTPQQIEAWLEKWETETGCCKDCDGTGFRWNGWSAKSGNSYRPCKRCEQTGRRP